MITRDPTRISNRSVQPFQRLFETNKLKLNLYFNVTPPPPSFCAPTPEPPYYFPLPFTYTSFLPLSYFPLNLMLSFFLPPAVFDI